jgi:hypothetical protein
LESASDPNLLLVNLVLGAASLVASVTGFGFALVSVPFLVVLLPPAQVVPIVLISWAPIAVALIAQCRRDLNRGRILRLLGGAAFGAPVGVFVLASLATDTMRAVIGGICLLAVASLAVKPARPFLRQTPALLLAGLASGVLGGASAMSGPPVVLLGLNQRWGHEGFRADLLCYLFLLHTTVAVALGQVGLLSLATVTVSAAALPGVLTGYAVGLWLKGRVDGVLYRRFAIVLVTAGGISALWPR